MKQLKYFVTSTKRLFATAKHLVVTVLNKDEGCNYDNMYFKSKMSLL